MELDYGTQISPFPIKLSIGTLKKPKLRDIAEMSFDKFAFYEFMLKMTPEMYYTKLLKKSGGEQLWSSFSKKEKELLTTYELITRTENLIEIYLEVFNYFFLETVIFREGFFILLKDNIKDEKTIEEKDIHGVISQENFDDVLNVIQQICCIYSKEEKIEDMKFKNNLAKEIVEKMMKAQKTESAKNNLDLTKPNIISSVCGSHPSLNYINIWDLTVFQLYDTFNRLQAYVIYNINSTSVAVWGDEKKSFDISLWYKNQYDTKDKS